MRDFFNKLQPKYFFLLTVVYPVAGALYGLILYYVFSAYYFTSCFFIVLFYWTIGLITNYLLDRIIRQRSDKLLTVYMILRMAKFLLTIIFLGVFELLVVADSYKLPFAIALMSNYVLYTLCELYTFNLYNKRLLNNAKKE